MYYILQYRRNNDVYREAGAYGISPSFPARSTSIRDVCKTFTAYLTHRNRSGNNFYFYNRAIYDFRIICKKGNKQLVVFEKLRTI